jgi:hypothetical protein
VKGTHCCVPLWLTCGFTPAECYRRALGFNEIVNRVIDDVIILVDDLPFLTGSPILLMLKWRLASSGAQCTCSLA